MTIVFQKMIYRADIQANPDAIYVFGDNPQRAGFGGQAGQCRGELNTIGICTCSGPGAADWSDANAASQCAQIDSDMEPLFKALRDGRTIVFPLDGIGTGIADLERRSPVTWAHLQSKIQKMKDIANG